MNFKQLEEILRAVFKRAVHKDALGKAKVPQIRVATEYYNVRIHVVGQQEILLSGGNYLTPHGI